MLCGVSYENALVAVAQVRPNVCVAGMFVSHMKAAARFLGYRLRGRGAFDIESATGILNLSSKAWRLDHVVVLREGLVIETDGTIYDADVYLAVTKAKPGTLLIAEPL